MINTLFKNSHNRITLALLSLLAVQAVTVNTGYAVPVAHTDKTCEELFNKAIKGLKIKDDPKDTSYQSATLAYLNRPILKTNINRYSLSIKSIDSAFFSGLFHTTLKRELDFAATHYVFYHGQMRDFLLPQDIYAGLYNIFYKKLLHDFFILRNKDKALEEFKSINDFQKHFITKGELNGLSAFDHQTHIKKQILPVNLSLFGNALFQCGECTFDYFITSANVNPINQSNFVKRIFKRFKGLEEFDAYKTDIEELNTLLSTYEPTKTGNLLQIFIPKKLVDSLVYRCVPCGGLFYGDAKPEKHPISKDLETYKNKKLKWDDTTLDQIQCRLLVNPTIVNPGNNIKIFRYYYETPNVKKYHEKLANLLKKITNNAWSMRQENTQADKAHNAILAGAAG